MLNVFIIYKLIIELQRKKKFYIIF